MQVILDLAWSMFSSATTSLSESLARDIPSKLPTIIRQLNIKPRYRGYVCCQRCFSCYDLDDFPDRCTQRQNARHRVCGAPLRKDIRRKGQTREAPVRKYLHHDLKDWMARMLSRPGFEQYLDRDVFEMIEDSDDPLDRKMRDIWDGTILRDFRGPDGQLFIKQKPNVSDGRYIFSLCMDEFNPYHNRQAGKKVSVGAIYMVCLNLPPHLRYRVENVFLVGIIPGPSKPSIEKINEILKPLVDDLLIFWDPGVFFSRTFRYTKGRLVHCVVVPLVCDLPATRQMAGFAGHSSTHFCSFCLLTRDKIRNLKVDEWQSELRTYERHLRIARKWKDASASSRKKIFMAYGIRWTELLRLPYWDPTRFVVVDSMHALLLNCIKRHLRTIWLLNVECKDGVDPVGKSDKTPTEDQAKEGWKRLRHGTDSQLEKLPVYVLKHLCVEAQVDSSGHKPKLLESLSQYVSLRLFYFWVRKSVLN